MSPENPVSRELGSVPEKDENCGNAEKASVTFRHQSSIAPVSDDGGGGKGVRLTDHPDGTLS
jgi:hypothetical protein